MKRLDSKPAQGRRKVPTTESALSHPRIFIGSGVKLEGIRAGAKWPAAVNLAPIACHQKNTAHDFVQGEEPLAAQGTLAVSSVSVPINRVDGSHTSRTDDLLAVEEALEIRLGQRSLSITMRTPGNDLELAAGFLFSESLICGPADIVSLGRPTDGEPDVVSVELVDQKGASTVRPERNFMMTSACGVCGKASLTDLAANACPVLPHDEIQLAPEIIYLLPDLLRQSQNVFDSTGGLHAAALFDLAGNLQSVREDVGRHNAVDKLVGAALLEHRLPLRRAILLVSGRASFELVQKALMAGIPIMAAVGAPSSLAVSTADRAGMTLIGFLRNNRFNVYCGSRRISALEQPQ
jgi:FdhD protein